MSDSSETPTPSAHTEIEGTNKEVQSAGRLNLWPAKDPMQFLAFGNLQRLPSNLYIYNKSESVYPISTNCPTRLVELERIAEGLVFRKLPLFRCCESC
jgi:hypothetical protein